MSRKAPRPARGTYAEHERWRYHLERKYGKGAAELYDRLLAEQDGCCAICGQRQEGRRLAMDEDSLGQIRALLCLGCNTGLGNFRHDAGLLVKAVAYMLRYSSAHH